MTTRNITNDDSQSDEEYEHYNEQSHYDPELRGIETFHEFNDGHPFRNTIDYLKQNFTNGTFRFYPKMITLREASPDFNLIVDIVLHSWRLPRYFYNSTQPFVPFSFSFNDFHSLTRSIGKSHGFMMYKHDEKHDPNGNLYFQISGATDDVDFIAPKNLTLQSIELPTYTRSEDDPSIVIPISDYCSLCKTLCHIKCGYVSIYGYYRGLKFEGFKPGNIRGKVKTFGSEDPPPLSESIQEEGSAMKGVSKEKEEESTDEIIIDFGDNDSEDNITVVDDRSIINTRLDIGRVKAGMKYSNISGPKNVLLVYIEKGKAMKLLSDIGGFGEMRVYIK